jgi:peptide/nickel transport system substrate-binding protein
VQYSNPEVDRLFDEALKELDDSRREEIFAQIHLALWEDQPYTWLYFRNSYYGFNKRLRGYNFSPRGPFGYGPGFSSIWEAAQP